MWKTCSTIEPLAILALIYGETYSIRTLFSILPFFNFGSIKGKKDPFHVLNGHSNTNSLENAVDLKKVKNGNQTPFC